MAKADHRAVTPRTERFATIAADYYPPLGEPTHSGDRLIPGIQATRLLAATGRAQGQRADTHPRYAGMFGDYRRVK